MINLSEKVQALYRITQELESAFPGRKFTLDGHLVGSIGEVLVAEHYNLTLLPNSAEAHDAIAADGRFVQIKATQINRVAISSRPDWLIVIHILSDGTWEEVYNGPGGLVWDNAGKMKKNGQRPISAARLKQLMQQISRDERV